MTTRFVRSLLVFTTLCAAHAHAQVPAGSDSLQADTARATTLPEIRVTVTRTPEPLDRVPYAIGVIGKGDVQRGQQTIGLDEAFNDIPGVVVTNRYNFSLDQRISIRGFGSRSNFGVRGLKILMDGVPQTLPDGQSQLTNVEFGTISHAEVLHGASSSLYGNASGGVVSLQTEPAAPGPFATRIRAEGGTGKQSDDDFYKWQSWTSGRTGNASGTFSVSQFKIDGYRQHSAAEIRQLNAGIDYAFSGTTIGALRFSAADDPTAENPGALTWAEYLANPDSAAANNINRGADKDAQQQQLSLSVRHVGSSGGELGVTVFGVLRDLKNPLAAPPPSGPGPTIGTYVTIDRAVGGVRVSGSRLLSSGNHAPRLTAGADVQGMRDDRQNFRSDGGIPTDSVLLDQREQVTEFGPFAQILWSPDERLLVSGGARYDWVRFDVTDHHLSDGVDNGGARTNSALSGSLGLSWSEGARFVPYANISTAFETPTTTELVNQPNGSGGFNDQLKPQRAVTAEIGARGRPTARVGYSVALFLGRIKDAIVQQQEVGGRAYFVNAGKANNDGAEIGVTVTPVNGLTLSGAYTYARYRFADYKIVSGTAVDTLDGNRLPGVPEHFWRFGLRTVLPRGFYLDADHTLTSSVFANDANTILVDSWGAGVTNARMGWEGGTGSVSFAPFLGVNNLWDRQYVGSVTLNGTGGRVYEPSPRRFIYAGMEIGYRAPS